MGARRSDVDYRALRVCCFTPPCARSIATSKRGGGKFAHQPAPVQDAYLRLLETGAVDLDGVPSAAFFDMLLKMTVEGFFSNPLHSAGRDRIGWRMAGFPGAYAARSAW